MHSAAIKVLSLPYKLLFAAAVDDEVPLLRRVCFPAETSANLRHAVECAVGKRAFSIYNYIMTFKYEIYEETISFYFGLYLYIGFLCR